MRRLYLAASGLGLSVLVSIVAANPPAESASDLTPATPAPGRVAAALGTEPSPDPESGLREELLRLREEKKVWTTALAESQARLQRLEAESKLIEAMAILSHVAKQFPQTAAGQKATRIWEYLADVGDATQIPTIDVAPIDPARPAFIDFGDVVVNLKDEGHARRYLKVEVVLQVTAGELDPISAVVSDHRAILKNRLVSYLSDQTLESTRGSSGQERLRDDIKNQFNKLLFPQGDRGIDDVLFQEFAVQ